MSAIIEITRRFLVRSGDANLLDWGSITVPMQPTGTACAGQPIVRPTTIVLAPGESRTIWAWATDGDFAVLFIECSGFAWLAQHVDAPTSPTDNTPAGGTSSNWPKDGLSCLGPRIIEGMVAPVVATSANYAGSAFHATTANGRRYELAVMNPDDAEDDITVTFGWTL